MEIKITKLECLRCGKVWAPNKTDVRQCPACKTAYWDVPREPEKKEEVANEGSSIV